MKCRFPQIITVMERKIVIPCGKCAWCRKLKRDQLAFRLSVEKRNCARSRFITLTYDDDHLPSSFDEGTGEIHYDVCYDDIRKFHKKLYKRGFKFRYFLASEYGPKSGRPHYHGIYFSDQKLPFEAAWDKGFVADKPAKEGSLKYVTKYLLKGSNVPDGSKANFQLYSRRPGLGYQFEYKGGKYILDKDGVKLSVPQYYTRNYMNSLDAKLKNSLIAEKLDYMSDVDTLFSLREQFDNGNTGMSFEEFIRESYRKDFIEQIKINSKEK